MVIFNSYVKLPEGKIRGGAQLWFTVEPWFPEISARRAFFGTPAEEADAASAVSETRKKG